MRYRAFTLIEILVVITIIAILAGLSAAVYLGVKSPVKRLTCTENLHQIGLATQLYSEAHDGLIPFHDPGGYRVFGPGTETYLSGDVLKPYGMTREQYRCQERIKNPANERLASDYIFRYHLDAVIPPSGAVRKYSILPNASTVLAWDWNHGVKQNLEEAEHVLYLRSDTSVSKTAYRSLLRMYPDAAGNWSTNQTVPNTDGVIVFPNEEWPPGLSLLP